MDNTIYHAYRLKHGNHRRNYFGYAYQWVDHIPEDPNFDFYFTIEPSEMIILEQSDLVYVGKFLGNPQTRISYKNFKNKSTKKQKC